MSIVPQCNMGETVTLEVGEKAPEFSCLDQDGNTHTLSEILKEEKGVVLYFYPKDNTPGCTIQACDFRDNQNQITNFDYVILGVSKDSEKSHKKFIDKYDLNFPLLMDTDVELHMKYGTWKEKSMYGKTYMGTARSTFVIGKDGILEYVKYNVKAKGHVENLLQEIKN